MNVKHILFTGLTTIFIISGAHAAILANVGDRAISDEQIKQEYDSITDDQRKQINQDDSTRKSIVDNAVNSEILVQAAKKAGFDKDEDYKKALDRFQRQYLASKFMQKNVEPKLSSGSIKKFFEENKTFFDNGQVCAHHILMQDENEAQKVATLAAAKGANFEELAKKYSIDPSVQENKGNLGCFTRDRMVAEFSAASFNMKNNEISAKPVRTVYGFHVIKVDKKVNGKVPGFDEVEQRVKETFRLKLVTELITDLRTKSNVKINDEAVKKFKL